MNYDRMRLMLTLLEEIRDRPAHNRLFSLAEWHSKVQFGPRKGVKPLTDLRRNLIESSGRAELEHEPFCGTMACAIGHAMLDRRFNALGFHAKPLGPRALGEYLPAYLPPGSEVEPLKGWEAVCSFFGIEDAEACELFMPYRYPDGDWTKVQAVIDRVRESLLHGCVAT